MSYRATAIDCAMLAGLEFKDGPPKSYMVKEAVENKKTLRLAESSFKTMLETGKFKAGCLSERVREKRRRFWTTVSPSILCYQIAYT